METEKQIKVLYWSRSKVVVVGVLMLRFKICIYIYKIFMYVFIGCAGSSLLCRLISSWQRVMATLLLHCTGFLLQWLLLLWGMGSRACGLH